MNKQELNEQIKGLGDYGFTGESIEVGPLLITCCTQNKTERPQYLVYGEDEERDEASEDFRLEATEDTEFFLEAVVVVVVAAEDFLTACCWPSLIMPKLMASSRAISLPDSGSVKRPVASSMRPRRKASWKVIVVPISSLDSAFEGKEDTFMVLRTVCVTVAVVTVMLSRLFRMAAPMGLMSPLATATSRGSVVLVAAGSSSRPDSGSSRRFMTACRRLSSVPSTTIPTGFSSISNSWGWM